MPYRVVRPFAYGADGIHGVQLVVGDVRDDFGTATDGLLAEKYITEAGATADETEGETAQESAASDEPATRRKRK